MRITSTPARRIVAANFFMMLGMQSVYFIGIIGCATYVLGGGAFESSALVFVMNAALMVGCLAGGPLVDAAGPRHILLVVLALLSATGVVGWVLPVSYLVLFALAVMIGLTFGAGTTAIDAYPRYFSADAGELARVNGLNQAATGLSVVLGPALAGVISSLAPHQCVFSILAFAPLAALPVVYVTRERLSAAGAGDEAGDGATAGDAGDAADELADAPLAAKASRFLNDLAEGARIVFGRADLRVLFIIGFLGFFAYGAFDSLESLFYRDVLRVGSDWMGWLSAISGVGGVVGSLLVLAIPKKRFSTWLLAVTLFVLGVGSVVYTATDNAYVAAAGQLICGVGFGALAPVRTTLVQGRCEPGNVGRVASLMRVGMNSAGTVPLLVAPALSGVFGVQAVLVSASLLAAVVGAFFMARFRRQA